MAEKLSDLLQQELDKMASALTAMREQRDAQARLVDCYRQEKEDLRRQLATAQADKERVVDTAVKMLAPGCDEYQALVRAMSFEAFHESTRGKCLHCIERDRDTAEQLCVALADIIDYVRRPEAFMGPRWPTKDECESIEAIRKRLRR